MNKTLEIARNIRNKIRQLHQQNKIRNFINTLSQEEINILINDWWIWARNDQLPPDLTQPDNPKTQNWRTWIILGGRGAGKTRAGAEWIRAQALKKTPIAQNGAKRIALIAQTISEARAVMIEGVSGILNIHPKDEKPIFNPPQKQIIWKNGTIAQIFSADEFETLRGPQFDAAWCDELCKWKYPQNCWDMLQFALRLGENPKVVISTTPKPIPILKKIIEQETTVITKASTYQNQHNLAPGFIRAVKNQYENTRLGRQEINGEIINDMPGALWNRNIIDAYRVKKIPPINRTVVAIDPPAGHKIHHNQCGIIVAARGKDNRIYVLEDATIGQVRPTIWAKKAIRTYHNFNADRIIAEINQGGDMVEDIIRNIEKNIPFKPIRATKGKKIRAEPIAALYEQGKISHLGYLHELEDQMCNFSNEIIQKKSPDRVDALIWAITDLINQKNKKPIIRRL